MYSLADAISVKADWGHSSNIVGVELCQLAHARISCLFHHEPAYHDATIARVLATRTASKKSPAPGLRCISPRPTTDSRSSCEQNPHRVFPARMRMLHDALAFVAAFAEARNL